MGFALQVPSLLSMNQGTTISAQVRVIATSKPYRSVSLSISGLPNGVSAQFSPTSGKPTFSSMLRLTSTAISAPGTFTLVVTARDAKDRAQMPIVFSNYAPSVPPAVYPADYYVAPWGNNLNSGSFSSPFATMQKAHDVMSAGQLVYMRGGTYSISAYQNLTKAGSSSGIYRIWAYPGEIPIIDANSLVDGGDPAVVINSGAYWWLRGITAIRAPSQGFAIQGAGADHNLIELCVAHHNERIATSGAAIIISVGTNNNQIVNCDSYLNGQPSASNGGSGVGCYSQGTGNALLYNRCWRNCDNGLELFDGANVLVDGNWVWETGYDINLNPTNGDGVGYKLGGSGTGDGNSTIQRNLAWNNRNSGFEANSADNPLFIYNNTAYNNSYNYITASPPDVAHQLTNNIAYTGNAFSLGSLTIRTTNSFDNPPNITVVAATFLSLNFTPNTGPRQADGSLPMSNFLRLDPNASSGNNAVNKGTNVGLYFSGSAPDLGAYEA